MILTRIFLPICLLGLLSLLSCQAQQRSPDRTGKANRLIDESSPYLLQHAYNPVDWYPWGNEALEKAQKEGKLLVISVGYAACHWCHVMEHESFEDSVVAALMNARFVSVKVDREERPDVDDVYMNACQLMSQQGCGWPLNAIALPDGRPIFAGTYFPRDQWLSILKQVSDIHTKTPEKTEEIATKVTAGIRDLESVVFNAAPAAFAQSDLDVPTRDLLGQIDFRLGGRKGAPKFPMPASFRYLLRYHYLSGDSTAWKAVQVSLDQMAAGGIYDQLGGGFARYATDAEWKVPHFEKMLYDNGQLVSLYAEAYRLTKNPLYKRIIEETLAFVEREMTGATGGFYSSLDADSEGEEGKFYVWMLPEIESALGADAAAFADYYNVTRAGNWEKGHSVLRVLRAKQEVAARNQLTEAALETLLARSREKLMQVRAQRVRPGLDDKVITAWNALMLMAYVDAYRALGEEAYLQKALKNGAFLRQHAMQAGGRLWRIHKDGKSSINAFLDDYALTAQAFVALYQVTFEEEWLLQADQLVQYALAHFFDEKSGMFYYTSDEDDPLIARKMQLSDDVVPGSNSSMATALFLLGAYLTNDDYLKKSEQMLHNMRAEFAKAPAFYANWLSALTWQVRTPYEVAIMGEDFAAARREMDLHYLPTVLLLGGKTEGSLELLKYKLVPGQTTIYVCQNKVCKLPVNTVQAALKLIER